MATSLKSRLLRLERAASADQAEPLQVTIRRFTRPVSEADPPHLRTGGTERGVMLVHFIHEPIDFTPTTSPRQPPPVTDTSMRERVMYGEPGEAER
jgi:hypothetical protein